MNGKKENERETEKDPETKRKGTEIKREMETYRNGDPERQVSGDIMGRKEEGREGQRSFYDIHVHIKPRATLKVHYW